MPPRRIGPDDVAPHATIPVGTVLWLELAFLLYARVHLRSTPLLMIWRRLTIAATVLAINLTGDVLRHSLAPQEHST